MQRLLERWADDWVPAGVHLSLSKHLLLLLLLLAVKGLEVSKGAVLLLLAVKGLGVGGEGVLLRGLRGPRVPGRPCCAPPAGGL